MATIRPTKYTFIQLKFQGNRVPSCGLQSRLQWPIGAVVKSKALYPRHAYTSYCIYKHIRLAHLLAEPNFGEVDRPVCCTASNGNAGATMAKGPLSRVCFTARLAKECTLFRGLCKLRGRNGSFTGGRHGAAGKICKW